MSSVSFKVCKKKLTAMVGTGPETLNVFFFFMLNSIEHEIYHANKC